MSIAIKPLHPVFAAEVTGLDLRVPLDSDTVQAIDAAINQYAVLVFPNQRITDEQQMAFSRNFGELETTVRAYRKDWAPRLDVHMADISNLDEQNRLLPSDDRRRLNAASCVTRTASCSTA